MKLEGDLNAELEMPLVVTTTMATDIQEEFTPPPKEVSSIRKQSLSATYLPHAYIERREATTSGAQNVCTSINVRRRLTTGQSSMSVDASRLPTTSEHHHRTTSIIINHNTAHGTTVLVSRIFDWFRNMSINNIQPDYTTQTVSAIRKQPLSTVPDNVRNVSMNGLRSDYVTHTCIHQHMYSHGFHSGFMEHLDCVVRPEIINFPNNYHENSHRNHQPAEHSRAHINSAHNEVSATNELLTPNSRKRKNLAPLSTARPKKASSSRKTKRRLILLSSKGHSASENRNYPPVYGQVLELNSSPSQDCSPPYMDLGDCDQQCRHCGCLFWYNERLKGSNYSRQAEYHLCCGRGKIYMHEPPDPPALIQQLLTNTHFMENIRAYNKIFAMTSFEVKIDDSVNRGRGPYVFKISGQIYHWIESLYPKEAAFNPEIVIVQGLIHILDEHNGLVRLFRAARDMYNACEIPGFKIRLYNMGDVRGYELLTSELRNSI
nr:helitron helicase-like domain-containing protein [Tanacetum cinerariifolium]